VILYVKVSHKVIKSGANDIPCVWQLFLERGRQSLSCSNINVTYVTVVVWKEGYQAMWVPTSTPFPDLTLVMDKMASYKHEHNVFTCMEHKGCTEVTQTFILYLYQALMSDILTFLLTPWSRVLLEKLTGSQLVKKFLTFYGTWRFITAFINAHHLSLSSARLILSDILPKHMCQSLSIKMETNLVVSHLILSESCIILLSGSGNIKWEFVHGLYENAIYGGRVDNIYDMRVLTSYLREFFNTAVLVDGRKSLGPAINVPTVASYKVCWLWYETSIICLISWCTCMLKI